MENDRLLTLPQFARAYGLSPWLAREMARRGDIPTVQCGRRRRVSIRMVQGWVDDVVRVHAKRRGRAKKSAAA